MLYNCVIADSTARVIVSSTIVSRVIVSRVIIMCYSCRSVMIHDKVFETIIISTLIAITL